MKRATGTLALIALAIVLSACGNDGQASGSAVATQPRPVGTGGPNAVATSSPEATPSAEETVLAAYRRYWTVYSDALLTLDTSRLGDVMTGAELERALREVENLRGRNRAVRIVVNNRPIVVEVQADKAAVFDEYTNQSRLIDPLTRAPTGPEPQAPEVLRDTFQFIRVGDVWKVIGSRRQAGGR